MPRGSGLETAEIEAIVRANPGGIALGDIVRALQPRMPTRTVQHRLKMLVDEGRLVRNGSRRWARYRLPPIRFAGTVRAGQARVEAKASTGVPLSPGGIEIRRYVRQAMAARRPRGYDRSFLDSYRPDRTGYLDRGERSRLLRIGTSGRRDEPAGTHARQLLSRLLIDLSWNSSRLEGNTYSLLDTKRLIDFGEEAEGKQKFEAQMILNHKDAIEFLVGSAAEIGFNRYTLLNLHAILAQNLLGNEAAAGRLRHIPVGIERSVFHPLETPQLIEECFDEALEKAAAIRNPFEQSFFVMVQLPYLQPFDDVNKRVSRLAANIPFIKWNLSPLSFTDVPRPIYTDAMLGVYELRRIELLRDVFLWAYERSAARYTAIRQSLGEPDPFRLRHRLALRELIQTVVRGRLNRAAAAARVSSWIAENIDVAENEAFREMADLELLSLHDGNFARYGIRPSEFAAWQREWTPG